ncbi:unnamed protein product, partial [Prorocentrum cordatum]
DWRRPLAKARAVEGAAQLPVAWGAVVDTIEQGLLDRYDHVGADRAKRIGRWARCVMGAGAYVATALRQIRGADLLRALDGRQRDELAELLLEDFFQRQLLVLLSEGFVGQAARAVEYASGQHEEALKSQQQAWAKWANDAFGRGAGQARRGSKVRDLQNVISAWHGEQQEASPRRVRDREVNARGKVWLCHGLQPMPELTVEQPRQAALSFPRSSAIGPAKIGMRALGFNSDEGMHVRAQLIMWGWLRQRPSVDIWGLGAGRSSSDAAFDLNLETEFAVNLQEQVITAPMDAWKSFETVVPAALLQEARQLRMPLHLVRLLIELCHQPGRALVGDVALQWVGEAGRSAQLLRAAAAHLREEAKAFGIIAQPAKPGPLTSSIGRRLERRQTRIRLQALARRRGRIAALQRAAGRKVACLRRTGLLPSTGHEAGVAGITDDELRRLGTEASRLVGARPGPAGSTVDMATQRCATYDPICEATVALVVRFASWIWDQRATLGRLQRAWATTTWRQIMGHFVELQPAWQLWLRVLRLCAGGKGTDFPEGPAATSLRIHRAGKPWTRQRLHEVRLADSAMCLACGDGADTPGHRLYGCEALLMVEFVATDLLALAREAGSWGEELEQDVQGYLELDIHPMLYAGNMCADWFAKQVALQRTVAQVHVDAYGIEVQHYKKVAAYIGWIMQRCLQPSEWQQRVRAVPPPPAGPCPRVAVVEHVLVDVGGRRGLLCRECGRRSRARSGAASQQFLRATREPSALARIKAGVEVLHFGALVRVVSGTGARAVAAMREAEGDEGDPPLVDGDPWCDADGGMLVHGGHRLRRAAPSSA